MHNRQGSLPNLVATAMLTNPAGVLGIIAPAIITGLTLEAQLSLAIAGRLLAIEFAAMTAGIMLLPLAMGRIGDRTLAAAAVAAAILGELSSFMGDPIVMGIGRGVLGCAEGALYGLAIGALARTSRPDRAFGVAVFLNLVVSATILTLATWAHLYHPSSGILILLLGFMALTALFVPAMAPTAADRQKPEPLDWRSKIAFIPGLVGIFLFAAGFGTVWPLVASVARTRGIGDAEIGHILSIAGGAGIAGAAISIVLAERLGRILPLALGTICLAVALAGSVTGEVWTAAPAVLFLWSFLTPYYFGSAAAADSGGRLAAFAGAMLPLGIAAGQSVAGVVLSTGAPIRLGLASGAMLVVAVICMIALRRQLAALPAERAVAI